MEYLKLPLVTTVVPFLMCRWLVEKTNRMTPYTICGTTEVTVPVDDNDIEGDGRYGRGEYGFKESSRGVLCGIDCFCGGLKRLEAFVPRQIEMVEH